MHILETFFQHLIELIFSLSQQHFDKYDLVQTFVVQSLKSSIISSPKFPKSNYDNLTNTALSYSECIIFCISVDSYTEGGFPLPTNPLGLNIPRDGSCP